MTDVDFEDLVVDTSRANSLTPVQTLELRRHQKQNRHQQWNYKEYVAKAEDVVEKCEEKEKSSTCYVMLIVIQVPTLQTCYVDCACLRRL